MPSEAQTCQACDTPLPTAGAPCPSCTADLGSDIRPSTLTPHPKIGRSISDSETGDILIGVTMGGCKIEEKIGQGGMGAVYRARHEGLDREVVVKILPPAYTTVQEFRDRFIREAQAAAKLSHPNVVQVHNVGHERGLLFYVMELIDGQSLEDVIQTGVVEPAEALRLIREAAKGLGAAHDSGIIHRDVKAANILVCPKGEVKVTDFGVARDEAKDRLSSVGQLLGTPHYMAPEQAEGKADPRSDLYALGVTLYQLVTGKLPFEGNSYMSIIRKHREQKAPSPKDSVGTTPLAVCRIIARLLQKDPKKRYQNVGELIADLDHVLAELGGETSTPPPSYVPPPSNPLGGRLALLFLGAACIAAVMYLAPPAVQTSDDPDGPDVVDPTSGTVAVIPTSAPVDVPFIKPAMSLKLVTPAEELVVKGRQATFVVELGGEVPTDLQLFANGDVQVPLDGRCTVIVTDLKEGANTVKIVGRSGGEEIAWLDVSVTVDSTQPWLEILEPRAEQVFRLDDLGEAKLGLKVTAKDPTLRHVGARVDLPDLAPMKELQAGGDGHSGWLTLRREGNETIVGRIEIEVWAKDQAGNENSLKIPVVIVPRGMVFVPGGSFRTGSDGPGMSPPRQHPPSEGFFIDTHEVTNARYQAFVTQGGGHPPRSRAWSGGVHRSGFADHPVHGLSYGQARRFAEWRGRRLPTEVEWEKAASWDAKQRRNRGFPWGDEPRRDSANTEDYWLERRQDPDPKPTAVGKFEDDKSPSGCYDMCGNLQEWTTRCYDGKQEQWLAPDVHGERQTLKGGCYLHRQTIGRTARREERAATVALDQVGFRCVRDLKAGLEVDR